MIMLRSRILTFLKNLLPDYDHFQTFLTKYVPIGYKYPIFLDYPVRPRQRYTQENPHPLLYEIMNKNRKLYEDWLRRIEAYLKYFEAIPLNADDKPTGIAEPAWINRYIPPLDSMALYTFLASTNPRHYFEVGSGNSTKFARRAIRDHKLTTHITSIDPQPRAEIEGISDRSIRLPLEEVALSIFQKLDDGDILFIDNSHRIFMNSDATTFFLDVLPYLKPGVLVQLHDIWLPYDYPEAWKFRYYSEQYCLAMLLLADQGQRYEIILPNMFISFDRSLCDILDATIWQHPHLSDVAHHGGSFWFKIRKLNSARQ